MRDDKRRLRITTGAEVQEPMTNTVPTWHREAVERGIDYIVLMYEKADGFAFCPTDLEKPFRVGGDYDGNMPTTAEHGAEYIHRFINGSFARRTAWFIPFAKKVADGVDFSLDDLQLDSRSVRLIEGRWPW